MILRALAIALASLAAFGCSSTPPTMQLDVHSFPEGARVFISRRGERAIAGKIGPIKGDVKSEELEEEFVLIGTAPLTYTSLLHEIESDATVLGIGGKVVLKFRDGVLRFEKPGFQTVERHVRFQEGEVRLEVELPEAEAPPSEAPAAP